MGVNQLSGNRHNFQYIPVRVWPDIYGTACICGYISTHTPVRVWLFRGLPLASLTYFNSHTREGVTRVVAAGNTVGQDFNSHTREGVTLRTAAGAHPQMISTHTPVRVWLNSFRPLLRRKLISTHTPVRVWPVPDYVSARKMDFNSHTREGVTQWRK